MLNVLLSGGTVKKPLRFQYYYRQDGCPAKEATDKTCICWHDEGAGPFSSEKHDSETPLVSWRIKPDNY